MPPSERRTKQGLLSIDRALLILAISAGMWAGVASTKVDSQAATITNIEQQFRTHEAAHGKQQLETVSELATLKQQMRRVEDDTNKIDANLAKLATSMATVVNRLPDPQ